MVEGALLRIPEQEGHIANRNIGPGKIIEGNLFTDRLQAGTERGLFGVQFILKVAPAHSELPGNEIDIRPDALHHQT